MMETLDGSLDGFVGSMACSLSPKAGSTNSGGEDMVQDFVRLHMMSILQPFAANVQELKAQIEELVSELSLVRDAADGHELRLSQHEQQLSTLNEGASQTNERLEKLQSEQMSLKREKTRLDGNHEMTKASLGKTKDTLGTLSSSVEELQKALHESTERINSLEKGLVDTEQRIGDQMETRLNKQGSVCKGLNERQAEILKTCQQAKTLGESANAACKKLADSVEEQNSHDLDSFASLRDRTSDLEAKLHDVDQNLQTQGNTLASTDKDLQHLKTWIGQVKDLEHIHSQQLEMTSSIKEMLCRLNKVETDIIHVTNDLASEKHLQNSEFCNLEGRITKNISEIVKWKDTLKAQCDILSSANERLDGLENGQTALMVRTETTDKEVQSLASWRQSITKKNDTHASMLEAARTELLSVQERIEGNSTKIQNIRGEMGNDQELLAKLGSRVDLCCKYFNGLGKGLQDTNRQIHNGENGLLPPKGGSILPAIPMPRTPRTNDKTPRKRSCPPQAA